jgi:hypothetical protein
MDQHCRLPKHGAAWLIKSMLVHERDSRIAFARN